MNYGKRQAIIVKTSKKLVDELLERNTSNRTIKKTQLEWLKKSIKSENFILTGQGIAVSDKGVLIDGQHRLMAIRQAGYPAVDLLIVTGLDERAKIYVDQHTKRTTADMLKLNVDQTITPRLASIINTHLKIKITDEGFSFARGKTSLDDVIKVTEKYHDLIQTIANEGGQIARAGIATAFFHYALKHDTEMASEIARQVRDGERLTKNDPAYQLREYLLSRKKWGGFAGQIDDYKNTVAACIAHATKQKISELKPAISWAGLEKAKK